MRVIGLDPSTKTGWVVLDYCDKEGIKVLAFGEWHFPHVRGINRVKAMADALYSVLDKFEPDVCVLEGYGYANKHTLATLVEIGTVLRYTLHLYRVKYAELPPKSLKQFVTGNGNSNKEKMMEFAKKEWGFVGTDNEVDAYGLAMFAYAIIGYYVPEDDTCMIPVHKWSKLNPVYLKSLQLIANSINQY
ncbi:MAG: crossover junction endodeoxyribonuclease RuvC [Chlamydiia bacterium]|nr:crossover junction endodeoxyribonuclease RuvC [Chlamydiia bacterium]